MTGLSHSFEIPPAEIHECEEYSSDGDVHGEDEDDLEGEDFDDEF